MPKKSIPLNAKAKAVLPSGKALSRAQVLKKLGLNPTTPTEAWLAVTSCGSNAAALNFKHAQQLLKSGKISERSLDEKTLKRIRG